MSRMCVSVGGPTSYALIRNLCLSIYRWETASASIALFRLKRSLSLTLSGRHWNRTPFYVQVKVTDLTCIISLNDVYFMYFTFLNLVILSFIYCLFLNNVLWTFIWILNKFVDQSFSSVEYLTRINILWIWTKRA